MTFWKKNKLKIIIPALIVLAHAAAFVFGDRNMPKQKDTSAQPTVAAPVEAPAQNAAESNTPDKVETEPTQTPTENVSEPSDDPQTGESAQANTEQPEYVSPEEVQASASGEYEEVGGMLIDTGTGKDKYQTDPVPEGKPIPVEPEDVRSATQHTPARSPSPAPPSLTIWTSATRKRWSWSRPTAGSCSP